MNSKMVGAVGAGAAIAIVAVTLSALYVDGSFFPYGEEGQSPTENIAVLAAGDSGLGIPYDATNDDLKQTLEALGISMTSSIELGVMRDILTYCTFFEGEMQQQLVEYCTSTELRDASRGFLGNIHMVGSPDGPKLAIAIIQVDPFLNQKQDAKTVFSVVVDRIVCDCWHSRDISGSTLDSISDDHMEFHINGDKTTSKSNIIQLDGRSLQLEITTNTEGYLWKLFVA